MSSKKITASEIGCPESYKYYQDGWCLIHISGSPDRRGKAYGYLIANEMLSIQKMLRDTIPIFYGHSWDFYVKKTQEIYGDTIPDEYRQELNGILEGLQVTGCIWSYWELLAWNCHISIMDYWWKITQLGKCNDIKGGSCFIATGDATETGNIIMAHNTCDNYYKGQWCNCIVELTPENGNVILMQTYYGYLSSLTDLFITGAGIFGCSTTIGHFKCWEPGVPCFIRLRNALQYADTLHGFTKYLLDKNGGDYASSWLLGYTGTGEIMKFDIGLRYHSIKIKKNGYFVGFNESEHNKIRNIECDHQTIFNINLSSGARRLRLKQLMEKYYGKINTQIGQQVISDTYDVYTKKDQPSHRTIETRYDLDDIGTHVMGPNYPYGTLDTKIITSEMAKEKSFLARWGSSSDPLFLRNKFCEQNPQWDFLNDYLRDSLSNPWSLINSSRS